MQVHNEITSIYIIKLCMQYSIIIHMHACISTPSGEINKENVQYFIISLRGMFLPVIFGEYDNVYYRIYSCMYCTIMCKFHDQFIVTLSYKTSIYL